METAQMQHNRTRDPRNSVVLRPSNDEFVCANYGFWATNHEAYAYHVKLCSIPANEETRLTTPTSKSIRRGTSNVLSESIPVPQTQGRISRRSSRYWSRLREVARAIVIEFGKNTPSGDCYVSQDRQLYVHETNVKEGASVDLVNIRSLEFIHFANPQQSCTIPH
jgi:hypothetical protein